MVPLQQSIQLYWVVKVGKLLHEAKSLTRGQVYRKFPHLMGALNEMEIIYSIGGWICLGGYQWSPTYSILSMNNFSFWHFFDTFLGPKLQGPF
jgi:hypothetical protein